METTESRETRLAMVPMHDWFLSKIDDSIECGNHFEAAWLEYACLENRYFRTLDKFKRQCKYCTKGSRCRKGSNQLAISTKVKCLQRLHAAGVQCVSESFNETLFSDTQQWIKSRNRLMHQLVSLENYNDDLSAKFEKLAAGGRRIVKETYEVCTEFRRLFYADGYEFEFPEACMEECSCKPRSNEKGGASN